MHGHHVVKIILVILLGLVIAWGFYNYSPRGQADAVQPASESLI